MKLLPTEHLVILGDSRRMKRVKDCSVHLIVTSPPYWNIKKYPKNPFQLGNISDYSSFLRELEKVWRECFRVLVPGGRLCIIVGDICLSRRKYGRHRLIPLHSDLIQSCLRLGFDYLAPIIWYKIANVSTEVKRETYVLGNPNGPNSIIKNDIEFILIFRKPGGYRKPSKKQIELSRLSRKQFVDFFTQVWRIKGESSNLHPAPFPLRLAERLIRMFSYIGDTILDPFLGSGTTTIAAINSLRNSVGYEVEPSYLTLIKRRIFKEAQRDYKIKFIVDRIEGELIKRIGNDIKLEPSINF